MDNGLTFDEPTERPSLAGLSVFLSTSIPDPARWSGEADPLEITDAVVAFARTFLTAGVCVVTAAHPTIAPLLLYVAAELPAEHANRVTIYQSRLFDQDEILPPATRRFEEEGIGEMIWTEAAQGDSPRPGSWDQSLAAMRRQMIAETEPAAAVYIGGMEGIPLEFDLFNEMLPGRPNYPIERPGGEARRLAGLLTDGPRDGLLGQSVYPTLWHEVLDDLQRRRSDL